ncbi:hypothetical protein [Burkholderia gladioli]|uniref:hypothetical protein n=1 Tax=Burkholderia gladioli TaxID=28095 RepID=UPI00163FD1BB|nr:hypothetical protein [Burkholderia gladioli]
MSDKHDLTMPASAGAAAAAAPGGITQAQAQAQAREREQGVAARGGLALACRWLAVLALAAVILPWLPAMPGEGLDPSWMAALNQALAQGLVFGRDIVFTLGPYAGVFTRVFHPATDGLVLVASTVFLLGYASATLALTRGAGSVLPLLLALMIAGALSRDVLLLGYPLLVSAAWYRHCRALDGAREPGAGWRTLLAALLMFAPFGLLPLVKGSMLPACAAAVLLCVLLLASRRAWGVALVMLLGPPLAAVALWQAAGQPPAALGPYLHSLVAMISGYEEGMALDGPAIDLALYLLPALALLAAIALRRGEAFTLRAFLLLSFAAFLFLCFKGGFVRHDDHALIAASAIAFAGLVFALAAPSWSGAGMAVLGAVAGWAIALHYTEATPARYAMNVARTALGVSEGIALRARGDALAQAYQARLAALRREHEVPLMKGSSDIYSFWQSDLLAAGNAWNPRPVIQSYAAYSPMLAGLNAAHLAGARAPDTVLMRVTPIDGKYPTLDDGPSWPVLMRDYRPVAFRDNFLYLAHAPAPARAQAPVLAADAMLGAPVTVPDSAVPLVASLAIEPSLTGRLRAFVLKPAALRIRVTLRDGSEHDYKLVSGMARAGFVLSPLVRNSTEFALMYGAPGTLRSQEVTRFTVEAADGGGYAWQSHYRVTLTPAPVTPAGEPAGLFRHDPLGDLAPADRSARRREGACMGGLLVLNETYPAPASARIDHVLSAEGWLVAQPQTMRPPERTYLSLTDASGHVRYAPTRAMPRLDVQDMIGAGPLPDLGYTAYLDPAGLHGRQTLGVAYASEGELVSCSNTRVALQFAD